ncbi:T9SS type A sorting domain-containing protein [Crocinitomix catalasitica]|nr:T9SS type A sorting domain-containing protein [Crocinitomix catalasitica]
MRKLISIVALTVLYTTAQGQYYFNNLYDLGGIADASTSIRYNTSTNTISAAAQVWVDNRPYVLTCDEYGNPIDTLVVDNDSIGSQYSVALQNAFYPDYHGYDVVVGSVEPPGSTAYGYASKLDSDGDTLWTLTLGDADQLDGFASMTICPTDSNYIFAGGTMTFSPGTDQRMWIVKTDTGGNVLWMNTFGGTGTDYALSIDTTDDSGYIMGGITGSFGAGLWDIYVVKTDNLGNMIWEKWFGFAHSDAGYVKTLPNGNFLVYGSIKLEDPTCATCFEPHGFATELDQDGEQIWTQYYSNTDSASWQYYFYGDWFTNVELVSDGIIFCGSSNDLDDDVPVGWMVKTDYSGNELWQRRFRKRDNDNYLQGVIELPGGDLVLSGYVFAAIPGETEDSWMIRTNCLGFDDYPVAAGIFQNATDNTIILQNSSQRFGDGIIYWGDGWSYAFTEFDDTLISHTYATGGIYSVMLVVNACYHSDTLLWNVSATMTGIQEIENFEFTLYPNPSNGVVTIGLNEESSEQIQISIYAFNGKRVYFNSMENFLKIEVDLFHLASGTYLVEVLSSQGTLRKQLVLQ